MTETISTYDAKKGELRHTADGVEAVDEDGVSLGTVDEEQFTDFAEEMEAFMGGEGEETMDAPTWDEIGVGQTMLGDIALYPAEDEGKSASEHPWMAVDPYSLIEFAEEVEAAAEA